MIYSSKWQGEPNWNKTDKRWQQASKIFHDINRFFSKSNFSHNQFMNPKSPQFIVNQAEVKKVDGKSVIAISGFELDGKTRKLNSELMLFICPFLTDPLLPALTALELNVLSEATWRKTTPSSRKF